MHLLVVERMVALVCTDDFLDWSLVNRCFARAVLWHFLHQLSAVEREDRRFACTLNYGRRFDSVNTHIIGRGFLCSFARLNLTLYPSITTTAQLWIPTALFYQFPNHVRMLKLVLKRLCVDTMETFNNIFYDWFRLTDGKCSVVQSVVTNGNLPIISFLLDYFRMNREEALAAPAPHDFSLRWASRTGNAALMELLLKRFGLDAADTAAAYPMVHHVSKEDLGSMMVAALNGHF